MAWNPFAGPKPTTTTEDSTRVGIVGASCDCCGKTGVYLNRQKDNDLLCSGCENWAKENG